RERLPPRRKAAYGAHVDENPYLAPPWVRPRPAGRLRLGQNRLALSGRREVAVQQEAQRRGPYFLVLRHELVQPFGLNEIGGARQSHRRDAQQSVVVSGNPIKVAKVVPATAGDDAERKVRRGQLLFQFRPTPRGRQLLQRLAGGHLDQPAVGEAIGQFRPV